MDECRSNSNVGKVVRLKTWEEFKNHAIELRLNKVVYNIEQGIKPLHLTSLRLILPVEGAQYIFLDFAKGDSLKKTGIPIHVNEDGIQYIQEQDVVCFLRRELNNPDLKTSSFWTM